MKPTSTKASPKASLQASRSNDRTFLIWQAHQVFRQRGYHATSMTDIGAACGMLKGSIYYHFASKQALMLEVLQMAHQVFSEKVFGLAYQEQFSPRQRLHSMLEVMEAFYFAKEGGCLMANVGLEVGDRIETFARIVQQFFHDWVAAFTHLFQAQYAGQQAQQQATAALQDIQGALMLSCIYSDRSFFASACQRILSALR